MILILCILNTAAWFGCIDCCLLLTAPTKFKVASTIVPSAILLVFIWSNYHLGQPSLILLFLMLGGFAALRAQRQALAGASIGLAAAIKAFPVIAIIYLLYRRYWYAAIAAMLTVLLLLFILPLPFRGLKKTVGDFRQWQAGMLRYREGGIAQRAARGYSWKNQSIFGLTNRLLRPVSVNDEGEPASYRNIANVSFPKVNVVIMIIALVLGLTFAAAIPLARPPDAAEFGAALILLLVMTPLAFGYLFSWLMLPITVLMQRIVCDESRSALWTIVLASLLLGATALTAKQAQIYGSVFFCALIIYFGLIAQLRSQKPSVAVK
jgi:hypothetical protein